MAVGLYVQVYPDYVKAGAEELPGCVVDGKSMAEALAKAPAAIASYIGWLELHGEKSPVSQPVGGLPEVETLEVIESMPPRRAALFSGDRGYLSDAELARSLRWLDYSRVDLLELVQDRAVLDLPTEPDSESDDPWTIRRLLVHVAEAEYRYARRVLGPWVDTKGLLSIENRHDVFELLAQVRDFFKTNLAAIPISERDRLIPQPWDNRPNDFWTLKKSIRRALEHEHEHIQQISSILYAVQQQSGPLAGG